jgi:hypothetical protein
LPPEQDAAISLPATLFQRVNDQENVGVFFAFYETATLFPIRRQTAVIVDDEIISETEVGSQIVAASIDSSQEITNLEIPVTIVFRLQINTTTEVITNNSSNLIARVGTREKRAFNYTPACKSSV